jgi:hypothetical protein
MRCGYLSGSGTAGAEHDDRPQPKGFATFVVSWRSWFLADDATSR